MTERETILAAVDILIARAEKAEREREVERKSRAATERDAWDWSSIAILCAVCALLGYGAAFL